MAVPFFGDFNKKTKDYFDREQYDFGQQFHFKNSTKDNQYKAKVTTGANVGAKLTVINTASWGTIEASEDIRKGLSLEIKCPNVYKSLSFSSKHSNADVEVTVDYRPSSSYWNSKVKAYYNPDRNNNRVCSTIGSIAVGDDSLHLNVGGEMEIKDEGPINSIDLNPNVVDYSLGFLYEPNAQSSYSLIYKPDLHSNGLEYNFSLLRNFENYSLAANAKGKVDSKVTATPPTISFAGGFNWGARYLQTFFNSNKEYGIQYKFKPSDFLTVQLGLATLLDTNQRRNTSFGFKVSVDN